MSARWLFVDAVVNKVYRLDEIYHFPTVIDGEMSKELNGLFDDLFETYTSFHRLKGVKTTNMGTLYELTYAVQMKPDADEKKFLDELRCRNGNLEINIATFAAFIGYLKIIQHSLERRIEHVFFGIIPIDDEIKYRLSFLKLCKELDIELWFVPCIGNRAVDERVTREKAR